MAQQDKETLVTEIMAKVQNMTADDLEKLLEKLQHPDPPEGAGAQGSAQPPKPGESQQGQGVHDYGKTKKP